MPFPAMSAGRGTDHLKKYWWVLVGAAVLIGAWLSLASMPATGSEEIAAGPATEQSLFSLDASQNPNGAPGGLAAAARAAAQEGSGKSGTSKSSGEAQQGSLWKAPEGYRTPGAAGGAPISAELAKELEAAAKDGPNSPKYAEAMAKVAGGATKPPDNNWGGKSARSGFNPADGRKPKLNAGKVGLSRSGGGGSTAASLKIDKAFGLGGKTGVDLGPNRGFNPGQAPAGRIAKAAIQSNKSFSGLKGAEKRSLDSLKGADEMAAGGGRQTFDASGARGGTVMSQLTSAGSAGLNEGAGIPTNLKETDAGINQKEIEVPEVAGEEAKDDGSEASKKYMQQQMMMMIAMMAISGIMGPTFSGMGTALAAGLGFGGGPSGPGGSGMSQKPGAT